MESDGRDRSPKVDPPSTGSGEKRGLGRKPYGAAAGGEFEEQGQPGEVEHPRDIERSADEELPVVARMVVEIRSNGSRTVARGGLEDAERNEQVAIRAEGTTPLALAASLTRALARAPFLSQALVAAPYAAGRAAGRAVRSIRGLLEGDSKEK